jgi:hypothetical protein
MALVPSIARTALRGLRVLVALAGRLPLCRLRVLVVPLHRVLPGRLGFLALLGTLLLRLILGFLPLPPLAGGLVRVGVHAARPVVRAMMTIPPQYLPTIIISTFAVSLSYRG